MGNDTNRPTMNTVFHADLSDAHPGEDYWVHAFGGRHPLIPHSSETLAKLRAEAPHLDRVPDDRITHYTEQAVEMPADTVVRVHIKHTQRGIANASAEHGIGNVAIHCPPPADQLAAMTAEGLTGHHNIDYVSTAKSLVFHHADLINKDPDTTAIINEYMDDNVQISGMFEDLGAILKQMGPPSEDADVGWAQLVPYTPPAVTYDPPINGKTGYDGTTTYYFHQANPSAMTKAGPVTTAMMKATKNDDRLQVQEVAPDNYQGKWTQQTGTSVETSSGAEQLTLAAEIEAGGDDWNASLSNTYPVHGLQVEIEVVNSATRTLKITLENTYIRYLGAYIRFYDTDGNAMSVPDWQGDNTIANIFTEVLDIQYDDLRYLGYIQAVNNVFAIPIVGDPGKLEVNAVFPEGAVSASIYGSGLGTGSDEWPKSPIVGGVCTGLLNLGIPAFMLAAATAAQAYKPLYDIVQDLSSNKKFIGAIIGGGVVYFGAQFGSSAANKEMNWHAFSTLAQLLFNQAANKALLWVEAQMAAEEAADEIPFAGWIMLAINIATGIAQIAETIIEVATSPWNIENKIATSITSSVTLHPDPRHGTFPAAPAGSQASYTVKMIYKDQTRATVAQEHKVDANSKATTLPAAFPGNTLGGKVKFEADYYIDDWLAGKATMSWIDNNEECAAQVSLTLVQYPIPLSDKSIYKHSSLLTYQDNAYQWQATAEAPTATIANRNTSSSGNAISDWAGISLSQKKGMIGFAWKAAGLGISSCISGSGGQLYAMQNIDIPGEPMDAVKFPGCGFEGPTQLIYDPYPPQFEMDSNGQWVIGPDGNPVPDPKAVQLGNYYIDPRKADKSLNEGGGYHLRAVTLDDTTPFDMGNDLLSWGRFAYFPNSFVMHPGGHIISVSTQYSKIEITDLPRAAAQDDELPVARPYAGEAMQTDRPGLLFHPVAVTCSYDGTVLILEDTKSTNANLLGDALVVARIQAFNLYGNPVNRFFDDQGLPSPFLYLSKSADYNYLDISAVGNQKMTYIYVLYYTGAGDAVSDYHMSIYQYGTTAPASNPLVTTDGVSAARLAVDMWHTAYTLNFAMTTDGKGNPAGPTDATTGPAGRTVPSISEWLPPVPSS